jgi:hypothetical protein
MDAYLAARRPLPAHGPHCSRLPRLHRLRGVAVLLALASLVACAPSGRSTGPLPTASAVTTVNPATLWYQVRGTRGTEQSWGVDTDAQGNIYMALFQGTPYDWFIYKLAPDGKEIWHQQWGRPWNDQPFIVVVAEPYVYIGGNSEHGPNLSVARTTTDLAVIALRTSDGALVWVRTYDYGVGYDETDGLAADGDALYVSGWATTRDASLDVALLKLNRSTGQIIWAQHWGSPNWDEANGQLVLDQDHLYIAGRYNAAPTLPQNLVTGQGLIAVFAKQDGAFITRTTWGTGTAAEDALGMTSDGQDLYTVGVSGSHGAGGQIIIRKYSKALTFQWERVWGGSRAEDARVIAVDRASGDLVIAGTTASYGHGDKDIVLLRYRPTGALVYASYWGGPGEETAQGLALFGDFAYMVGSTTSVGAGGRDAVLIKAALATGQVPPL